MACKPISVRWTRLERLEQSVFHPSTESIDRAESGGYGVGSCGGNGVGCIVDGLAEDAKWSCSGHVEGVEYWLCERCKLKVSCGPGGGDGCGVDSGVERGRL